MGLGHFGGGVAAARWLARRGDVVTVTDLAPRQRLADALEALAGEPIAAYHLGEHREEDFRTADLVVVNPAVPPGHPAVRLAAETGAQITSEIELFLDACPARVIGVTGSNGKSTTAAMTAAAIQTEGRRAWLGGNIGHSLLDDLPRMTPDDWVVLELSSFQLWHLSPHARPVAVAIVTSCTPNHLNWHPGYEHYVAAKQRLLTLQTPQGQAVLNTSDAEVSRWTCLVRGALLAPLPDAEIPPLGVPGRHNRSNAALAAAAALGVGCTPGAVRAGLTQFSGLGQRLELTATVAGRRLYNDSAATTPESTIEALRSLPKPLWLLAGGTDKGADLAALFAAIAEHAHGAAFFGAVGPRLHAELARRSPALPSCDVPTLADALAWCWQHSQPGDSIVLSPGFSSHDQFTNYRHRGEHFDELVRLAIPGV